MLFQCFFILFVATSLCRSSAAGSGCSWGEYNGTCIHRDRCLSLIKDSRLKETAPICDSQGLDALVCCTDCPEQHVANVSLGLLNPQGGGVLWKTGKKSWDACIDYVDKLPYLCRSSYYSGLMRRWNDTRKCHHINYFAIGGPPADGDLRTHYPHTALLGYGENLESAKWLCRGSLISDKYILTTGHCANSGKSGPVKYVALGILQRSDSPSTWQRHTIKRIINHPGYTPSSIYNDIALLETETAVEFTINALPACLPVNPPEVVEVFTSVWSLHHQSQESGTGHLYGVELKKLKEEECQTLYPQGQVLEYNSSTQMCYAEREYPVDRDHCLNEDGSPLLMNGQVSRCQDTLLGVTSRGGSCVTRGTPVLLTRVEHYVPWIESVVWSEAA